MKVNDMKARLLNLEETFKKHESELTELDRAIGDGDHGVNMVRGFSSLKDKLDDSSMQSLFKSTGMALMSNVGGASGPLYGFSFVKMSAVAKNDMNNQDFITLIQAFAEAVESRGKVTLNEKTMYDVVARAAEKLKNGETLTFNDLQQLADNTKDMVATKGRAAYFGEESKGYIDPGAQSMVYILNALIGVEMKIMPKIILVSHSKEIASGTKSLLKQMAGDVDIIPIGGLPDGSIGTSFDIIQEVLTKLEDDALCFYDIGSSEMNVDMAIEMYDGNHRVLKVDAPIVEGSFIAAVKLSIGGSIDDALAEIKQSF